MPYSEYIHPLYSLLEECFVPIMAKHSRQVEDVEYEDITPEKKTLPGEVVEVEVEDYNPYQ